MPGAPDPIYVGARRALLDALEALGPHRAALVLVGAQAIYLHTGEADLAVALFTKDGDLVIDPARLTPNPRLEDAMRRGGFELSAQPGIWRSRASAAEIDLLVPEAVAGTGGRRGARLEGHAPRAARKVHGLEGALVDRAPRRLEALDLTDPRSIEVNVAGPAALLVAKLHKLGERQDQPRRLLEKDALDVYRLLVAVATHEMAAGMRRLLSEPVSSVAANEAVAYLERLFGSPSALGVQMAAAGVPQDPDTVAQSASALAADLLAALYPEGDDVVPVHARPIDE